MIQVETISIKEFRGIRDLTLDFKGKNFAISGPNGTGKSGIVDALEFVLTGNVSRLAGEGRGDVSLKQHAPHVDRRNAPDEARVTIKLTIPSLRKTATIERSVKEPSAPTVTPNDPEILAVVGQVQAHPETVLSRRELIRYVLATPGKRADEVQALLHLDQVQQVRMGLQKIANTCKKQLASLETSADAAATNLKGALGLAALTKKGVLAETNSRRVILGLAALSELTGSTSLKDGIATPGLARPARISKTQAVADIKTARDAIANLRSQSTVTAATEGMADLDRLASDTLAAAGVTRERFHRVGLTLIEAESCPFCDKPWDLSELRRHVLAKLDQLKEVSRRRAAVEAKIAPLIRLLRSAQSAIDTVVRQAVQLTPPVATTEANDYSSFCATAIAALEAFLPLASTRTTLTSLATVPQSVGEVVSAFEKAVASLPEPTKQDSAREWLTIAQERLEVYREAMRKQQDAKEKAVRARRVYDVYAATSDTVLTKIYGDVEKDFAAMYGFVNRDDEDKFKASLVPSMGKLGFDVDFYGRGFFPPGAYHSEGHQDAMGICLYLALMRRLQGAGFTLAVLDDVLMSVDAGHRREICALLKKEFPNTQFIMTTHDKIWLRHMKTEGLIGGRAAVEFRHWSVDQGPARWVGRDVWTEIDGHLERDDVRGAAALLRHYLEHVSAELCHRLRAPVEFRGDAQHQLGDLLPPAIAQMRKLIAHAKDAANTWNQKTNIEQLGALHAKFGALATASQAEQWQVNVAVHFNSWEDLGKQDFAPVAKAHQDLLRGFACPDCLEFLRVVPDRGTMEALRCDCGQTALNLKKKT